MLGISQEEALRNILAQNGIGTREYDAQTSYQRKEFNRKYGAKVFERAREIGMERGHRLIKLYNGKMEEGTRCIDENDEELSRFDFLDL